MPTSQYPPVCPLASPPPRLSYNSLLKKCLKTSRFLLHCTLDVQYCSGPQNENSFGYWVAIECLTVPGTNQFRTAWCMKMTCDWRHSPVANTSWLLSSPPPNTFRGFTAGTKKSLVSNVAELEPPKPPNLAWLHLKGKQQRKTLFLY